ncbi:tetratricopeptide repeat protein [Microbulbifer hainanensis]|uniref:tetratricopeptide repeat protein n=1 Tax=Microbulbifer hainanensis TaxID=2735675 RepID=UPI001D027309|nr:tetratricopeptide repeat protein [Microbulbifer hainanensis]
MLILFRLLLVALLLGGCDRTSLPDAERESGPAETTPAASIPANSPSQEPPHPAKLAGTVTGTVAGASAGIFVGTEVCASCHEQQFQSWRNSQHDLAMREANDTTVAGNFDNAEFNYFGTVSKFFRRDGDFYVRTDGADGKLHDFPIAYTFGVYPLQQYLVKFPGGRLQALSIAWDSRSKSEGGQRWFHLNPDEHIEHGDELHWTGLNYNWNFMCADCHSTNLQKNYDSATHTYDTKWSEINVACEACHGPGSRHVQWAKDPSAGVTNKGLKVSFASRKLAAWHMNPDTGIAQLVRPAQTQTELETCAQCHSRRTTGFPGAEAGDPILAHFNLTLLSEPLYHADGQINDEVYVYGSFLQSKMHAAGVTCSNCHDPHNLKVRIEGNGLCGQCHLPSKFDTPDHHMHPVNSSGAQCVSCHMPTKTYMQVDARRDHSFRIPRPDLSDRLQTPNACTGCHSDKSNAWAAAELERKFGKPNRRHYGEALYAGRHGLPGAEGALMALIVDEKQPEIARATAVSLLPHYLSRNSAQLLQAIAQGDNALLQLGLADSLQAVPQQVRPALAIPLLYEDEPVIAALAANALVGMPMDNYPASVQQQFARALNQYLEQEKFNSDRPESLANLAGVRAQQGQIQQAEALFQQAISLAPYYTPAYVNLADLYRASGREGDAESLLRTALGKVTVKAPVQHSLGLSLVRQQRKAEALKYLHLAAESSQGSARYVYVYGLALNSVGKTDEALNTLDQGLARFPGNVEILQALASINRETGNLEKAKHYADMLR